MAFNEEWLRPGDRRLTAEEVRALPDGTAITLMYADRHGEKCWRDGIIKTTPSGRKIVEPIGTMQYMPERITIRDYAGKAWVLRG